jgi:hypothetical protein
VELPAALHASDLSTLERKTPAGCRRYHLWVVGEFSVRDARGQMRMGMMM